MADAKRAFALKENAQESFVDASVRVAPDGRRFSVGAELEKGKGVIVTDDPNEIDALSGLDLLKEVPAAKVAEVRKDAAKSGKKDGDDR